MQQQQQLSVEQLQYDREMSARYVRAAHPFGPNDEDDEDDETKEPHGHDVDDHLLDERLEDLRVKEDEKGYPVAGYMIEMEDLEMLGELLELAPELLATAHDVKSGTLERIFTPLMYAVYKNRAKSVAFLLERGADVNTRSESGESVLVVACSDGCPRIAKLLISHGAKLDLGDKSDRLAVQRAFDFNQTKFLECVFSQGGVTCGVETSVGNRYKWLQQACAMPNLTLVKCLLDQGLDIDAPCFVMHNAEVTPLMLACELGEVAIVRELVERGAKIDLRNSRGTTPIIYACGVLHETAGEVQAIRFLIDRGATVDLQDEEGYTALMLASQKGHSWIVRCLLEAGANADLQNKIGRTALMVTCAEYGLACKDARSDIVNQLLRAGAGVDVRDKFGQTALIVACAAAASEAKSSNRARESIVELLIESGSDLDVQDAQGATALISASQSGHARVVGELLARGAKVDLRDNDGQTALMRCCDYGSARGFSLLHRAAQEESCPLVIRTLMQRQESARGRIAVELLDHGAQVDLQDAKGFTPLILACRETATELSHETWVQHTLPGPDRIAPIFQHQGIRSDSCRGTIVRELLQRGANVNLQDLHGYTALMHAVYRDKLAVLLLLAGHGAALDLCDCQGATALMKSVQYQRSSSITHLITTGASVDAHDNNGTTALMLAAQGNNFEAASYLAAKGADLNRQDNEGKTALMRAARRAEPKLYQLLIGAGTMAGLQAKDGSTALMAVVERGSVEGVNCFLRACAEMDYQGDPKVTAQRSDGMTALMLAVQASNHHATKLLGQYRRTLNQENRAGMTALMLALAKGDSKAATTLLEAGAAVNTQSKDGTTPLVLATRRHNPGLVKRLLEQDTSHLDLQRKDGSTALMLACAQGVFGVAKLLICGGANVNLQDASGRTALRILASSHAGATETARLLVDRGAELDFSHLPSPNVRAALAIACREGYTEVTELLGDKYYTRPADVSSVQRNVPAQVT